MDAPGQHPDEPQGDGSIPYVFPRAANTVAKLIPLVLLGGTIALTGAIWFWFSPKHYEVGYQPKQPVAYSHRLHAGQYGIDCRYCHTSVEEGPHANVPPTETCMNCHTIVKYDSPLLAKVRESYKTGEAIPWVRATNVADFAYFDHSRHVTRGVGCSECHGRVDQMDVVRVVEPLSMRWCLECHRDPAPRLRPQSEITNLAWNPPAAERRAIGEALVREHHIAPPVDCSGCHR